MSERLNRLLLVEPFLYAVIFPDFVQLRRFHVRTLRNSAASLVVKNSVSNCITSFRAICVIRVNCEKLYREIHKMSTVKMTKSDLSDVIKRLMSSLGKTYEYEIGQLLDIERSALSQRKKRGSIPVDRVVTICRDNGLDVNWVLTGEGDVSVPSSMVIEGMSPEQMRDTLQKAIDRIEDSKLKVVSDEWPHLSESTRRKIVALAMSEAEDPDHLKTPAPPKVANG